MEGGLVMKVVNEVPNGVTPRAGCVCSEGWKSTRGLWDPDCVNLPSEIMV